MSSFGQVLIKSLRDLRNTLRRKENLDIHYKITSRPKQCPRCGSVIYNQNRGIIHTPDCDVSRSV